MKNELRFDELYEESEKENKNFEWSLFLENIIIIIDNLNSRKIVHIKSIK